MKILYTLSLVLLLSSYGALAQKYVPVIKKGSVIGYNVESRNSGATANITLTMLSFDDPVKIKWDIPYVGTGTFEMSAKSMQSAIKTIAEEPTVDEVTKIPDDKTLVVLSKDSFSSLVNNKTFKLNGYTFNVQTDTAAFIINDKPADVFYAVSTKGDHQVWILNYPGFPLICRAHRVTTAIDFKLVSVTE